MEKIDVADLRDPIHCIELVIERFKVLRITEIVSMMHRIKDIEKSFDTSTLPLTSSFCSTALIVALNDLESFVTQVARENRRRTIYPTNTNLIM